jgi:hypothetical protein
MERDNRSSGANCEMHREVIPDLKGVYYRGRFWGATAWSRIGKGPSAEDSPKGEPQGIRKPEVTTRSRKSREGLRPAA